MDELLKYASLITLCGAAISFVIGLIKWIDQRNREQKQKQKQYEALHKMVLLASGVDESGQTIKMVQQIAAIYQLQSYKDFAFASVPVLELMLFEHGNQSDPRSDHLIKAIKSSIHALKEH
ncbi:hypothetical protein [Vibrio parahaemolyticus]|uniref:hypothetical protein n=1 Tax=Vibrio parahaemolyticus TaxID=670 RepID=UPI0011215666|nr:hypothetical protein [Vibrio parahaemolyticus]TOD60078.1 hypothetical protein CGJ61_21790 [Vibrio parahaemolyticus]